MNEISGSYAALVRVLRAMTSTEAEREHRGQHRENGPSIPTSRGLAAREESRGGFG